jgi:hypothetical protein
MPKRFSDAFQNSLSRHVFTQARVKALLRLNKGGNVYSLATGSLLR